MARATTETLLSLDEWAAIVGLNPWEFNGISAGLPRLNEAQCQTVWQQYQWQRDFLSREEVAQAIMKAEEMLAEELLYYPAPKVITNELRRYPTLRNPRHISMVNQYNDWRPVQVKWHKVQSVGTAARSVIAADEAVTFVDRDGDGIDETFELTLTTDVDVNEIALYYSAAFRMGAELDETWRIRPLTVTRSGADVIIRGHITLLVNPALYEAYVPENLNAADANNYMDTVDVYRRFVDTTATNDEPMQGRAIWDIPPGCSSDCVVKYRALCATQREPDVGYLNIKVVPCDWPYLWQPDRLLLHYVAGEPRQNGRMSPEFARMVAYLAVSLLPSEKCGCERSDRIMNYWKQHPALGDTQRPLTAEEINNSPFGVGRGALYAWKRVEKKKHLQGLMA